MPKALLLLALSLLFLLSSCFDTEKDDDPTVALSLDSLSTTALVVDTGAVSRLKFAFTSPEYINQADVNIEFYDAANAVADEVFEVTVSKFSLMSATMAEEKTYFDITPKAGSFSGSYTAIVTIMQGASIDSAIIPITLQGITPYSVSITLENSSAVTDTGMSAGVKCYIETSEQLTHAALSLEHISSVGESCDSYFLSTVNIVSINEKQSIVNLKTTPQTWCFAGTYELRLIATIGTVSDTALFYVTVNGVTPPTIVSVEDVTVTAGNLVKSTATIQNAQNLNLAHLHIENVTTGDSASLPLFYKGNFIDDTTLVIGIDCKNTPAGTYVARMYVGNSAVTFTVTVQEEIDVRFMHTSPYISTIGIGDSIMYKCSLEATGTITDTMVTYRIFNGTEDMTDHFFIETPAFASTGCEFFTLLTASTTVPTGSYFMHIGANVGGVVSIDSAKIFVKGVEIESIEDATLQQGEATVSRFSLKNAGKIDPNQDIRFTVLSSQVADSLPVLTVSMYYNGNGKIRVNAEDAAAGTYLCEMAISDQVDTFTVTVTPKVIPPVITVTDLTLEEGTEALTTAVIRNGENINLSEIDVRLINDFTNSGPGVNATAYDGATGILSIAVDASLSLPGTYEGRVQVRGVSKSFQISVTEVIIPVIEKVVKLYNPYAMTGFNSAYDMVGKTPVAGEVSTTTGKMQYASADSLIADIAVDNNMDIRNTHVVAEVTSMNGGFFSTITKAEYEAITNASQIKTLAASKTFTDNELIITVNDDITVDGFYIMRLGNSRGYAVIQLQELNPTDTEASDKNTGYLKVAYKHIGL